MLDLNMSCEQLISRHASVSLHRAQNHDFQKRPDLLFLHAIISRRINTYKIPKKSRIALIRINLKSTRINTSGNKGLKSCRINTSGNKDLKSRRINTSKKGGRGVGGVREPVAKSTDGGLKASATKATQRGSGQR